MKKVLALVALTAVAASANGLAVGFDRTLAGTTGISAKFDVGSLVLQGVVGAAWTATADKADVTQFVARVLVPMGARGALGLHGGAGLNTAFYADDDRDADLILEFPLVASYKVTDQLSVSTQLGFVLDPDNGDGMFLGTSGSLLGGAGFHVHF
jgi:hypothetical protein